LPFAELPSLRNMVLTGEDDGDMSYMRLQERQLKPGRSNARALPPAQNQQPPDDRYDESAVVPFHGARGQQGHGHLERGRQAGRNHDSNHYSEREQQSRRGGFR